MLTQDQMAESFSRVLGEMIERALACGLHPTHIANILLLIAARMVEEMEGTAAMVAGLRRAAGASVGSLSASQDRATCSTVPLISRNAAAFSALRHARLSVYTIIRRGVPAHTPTFSCYPPFCGV